MGEAGNNNDKKGKGTQNNRSGMFFCLIIALVMVLMFFYMMHYMEERTNQKVSYNEFIEMLEGGQVAEVQLDAESGRILIIPKQESQMMPSIKLTYYLYHNYVFLSKIKGAFITPPYSLLSHDLCVPLALYYLKHKCIRIEFSTCNHGEKTRSAS